MRSTPAKPVPDDQSVIAARDWYCAVSARHDASPKPDCDTHSISATFVFLPRGCWEDNLCKACCRTAYRCFNTFVDKYVVYAIADSSRHSVKALTMIACQHREAAQVG